MSLEPLPPFMGICSPPGGPQSPHPKVPRCTDWRAGRNPPRPRDTAGEGVRGSETKAAGNNGRAGRVPQTKVGSRFKHVLCRSRAVCRWVWRPSEPRLLRCPNEESIPQDRCRCFSWAMRMSVTSPAGRVHVHRRGIRGREPISSPTDTSNQLLP